MRTVAKAAAFSGYRSNVARRAANFPPATVHVGIEGESNPLISSISSEKAVGHPAMVQWPACEIDDWVLTGGKEEEAVAVMAVSDRMLEQPARFVFGSAPTLKEATEATADLKEAIEKVYFSSATVEAPVTVEAPIKISEASVLGETEAIVSSVPKHVVQAFSLLQESPEAQSVVASLASDKNVWDAVMKNDKVMEFYNKNQSVLPPPESDIVPKESVRENVNLEGSVVTCDSPIEATSQEYTFSDIMQNIKLKVSEMVSNVSCILQDFLASSFETQSTTATKTDASTSDKYVDVALGASFIALAVATILVVLVKRG